MFRLMLLVALLCTVAWCVLVAPARDASPDAPPPPSLTEPMRDSVDRGLRDTATRAKERALHGLRQTGRHMEEAGGEAHEWLSGKTSNWTAEW